MSSDVVPQGEETPDGTLQAEFLRKPVGSRFRVAFRPHLRRTIRQASVDLSQPLTVRTTLRQLLDTPDTVPVWEELEGYTSDMVGGEPDTLQQSLVDPPTHPTTGGQRPIGTLFRWVWEHRQEIIDFVLMLKKAGFF